MADGGKMYSFVIWQAKTRTNLRDRASAKDPVTPVMLFISRKQLIFVICANFLLSVYRTAL